MVEKGKPMREKLARCAFELFARSGFGKVNLDAIAAQAGVTKGSLYWHYRSKKELILAACDHYYQLWVARAKAEMETTSDPIERLRRVLGCSVDSCLFDRDNRVFTTEIFAMGLQDEQVRESWAGFYDMVRRLYAQLIAACAEAECTDTRNPTLAADWMLATIEGIKQRAAFEPEICTSEGREEMVEGLLRIALQR